MSDADLSPLDYLYPTEADIEWGRRLLRRFTYKPGRSLDLDPTGALRVDFVAPQASDNIAGFPLGSSVRIGHRRPLRPFDFQRRDEDVFFKAIRRELHEIEKHEADEWIRIDGDQRWHPHRG